MLETQIPSSPRILDFELKHLHDLAARRKQEYQRAKPFPHCCIDRLFPDELLDGVVKEIEASNKKLWMHLEREQKSKHKSITADYSLFGPYGRHLFSLLWSPPFLSFLQELTGIPGLVPDPYMLGGGWHEMGSGGFLELHADFNWNDHIQMYRRINVIVYLNRDWKEEYNGALELYDRDLKSGVVHYPTWNRTVIANVTAGALHGLPKPIQCPEHVTRKSVAVWYYTADLPKDVQIGYDLCEPNFIERKSGGPRPLARPLRRWAIPPMIYGHLKRRSYSRKTQFGDLLRILGRLVPPIVYLAYFKLVPRRSTHASPMKSDQGY